MRTGHPRKHWTPDELAYLRKAYPTDRAKDIAQALGCRIRQVFNMAWKLGLKKPVETIAQHAREAMQRQDHGARKTRFQPGHATWNKGTHFTAGGRSAETRFKPGQKPHTWHPIGHERITKDGYLQRKMTDTGITRHDYVPVHHLIWREAGRDIPAGHALVFKNRNKTDIRLDNLELIPRAELMRRNSVHNYGPDIARLHQLQGAITRQINRKKGQPA